jgi:hypothetical protein
MLPAPELASVHGGNTFTGSSAAIDVGDRSSRWAFGVLGVAALAGAIAAVVFGSKHDDVIVELPPTPAPIVVPAPTAEVPTPPTKPPSVAVPVKAADIKTDIKPAPVEPPTNNAVVVAPPPTNPTNPTPPPTNSSFAEKVASARRQSGKQPPTPGTKTPASSRGNGQSFLQVDEWNGEYASISIDGQSHDTPGAKFYLPAGTYTMTVRNDTEQFKCPEKLEAGKSRHIHVSLENQQCTD